MERKSLSVFLVMLIFVFGFSISGAHAMDDPAAALSGLKGIYVNIAPIDSNLESEGVTANRLRNEAEGRLKKDGINILKKDDYDRYSRTQTYQSARLDISVTSEVGGSETHRIYVVRVQIIQEARLLRKPIIKISAPTWEALKIAVNPGEGSLIMQIQEALDLFIQDFRSANSR